MVSFMMQRDETSLDEKYETKVSFLCSLR